MAESEVPSQPIPVLPPFPKEMQEKTGSGCLKAGLIGCSLVSVVLIAGLIFLGTKAKSFLDVLMVQMGDQVVSAATPEVTEQDKTEFREQYKKFMERSKTSKVSMDQVREFIAHLRRALTDGRITPDEIHELTQEAKK